MRVGLIVLKVAITLVIFVAVWWILNAIAGDGFTAQDATTAVIAGLVFVAIFSVSTNYFAKRKRTAEPDGNRSDS
jgi:uncharacterized membrane protein YwzB